VRRVAELGSLVAKYKNLLSAVYKAKPNVGLNMKARLHLYGSTVSALLACLCAAPARHYASNAYTLWLSQQAADTSLARSAARANHLWAATMLAFVLLAALLLVAGLRSRQRGITMHQIG
jgi:hypothetical protein